MNKFLGRSKLFFKRNGSTILTCAGAVGVVVTTVTAVKATPKALTLLEKAKEEKGEELTNFEKVKAAAPVYIPTAIVGVGTIACVFGANVLNKRQQAALMSAYALVDGAYKEYRDKVKELYGEEADSYVKQEIAKDKFKEADVSVTDENKILFYDDFSQRYFESTMEKVKAAEYEINRLISVNGGAFLNEYYDLLGIEQPEYGDYIGWSQFEMMETSWNPWLDFFHDKVELEDGLECIIIVMGFEPTYDFLDY